MTTEIRYPLVPPSLPEPAPAAFAEPVVAKSSVDQVFLGKCVIRPFIRDGKRDFRNEFGEVNVRAAVAQVLGTICSSDYTVGELPWRPEFGSLLYLLRHLNNDLDIVELAKVYVADAVRTWEPRIDLKDVKVSQVDTGTGGLNTIEITVRYSIVDRRRNSVLVPSVTQTELVGLPIAA